MALGLYQMTDGTLPVRDRLLGLPEATRREIGQDLRQIQFRWPVGAPPVRPLGKGPFEMRS